LLWNIPRQRQKKLFSGDVKIDNLENKKIKNPSSLVEKGGRQFVKLTVEN
jgi:hypothetical protein